MTRTNPTPRPSGTAAKPGLNASASLGAARHFKKMATQTAQLSGEGAFTGGLATSSGAPKVSNTMGKFTAKGDAHIASPHPKRTA